MLITKIALLNQVDVSNLESERANSRASFDKRLLDFMGIRKVKGIWPKKDEDVPEGSAKPKRVKTRATKKTPPPRKSLFLTTLKETSLDKSLEKKYGSTEDPVQQQFVDVKFSDEEEVPPKEPSPAHLARSFSFEVEEEDEPVAPPLASKNPESSYCCCHVSDNS